ncbi:MAG: protein regulator of cytokinesis family protein [Candidatus Omnitrophica bacterium]|nr:protein regulator of cytokinesis family protein [Candidatus Omnitrophota bacterium]
MKRNWIRLFIAILLLVPIGFLQVSIDYSKQVENLESSILLMPGQIAGSLILSGFKGLAADLLWLNIENYWHSGQHYKMLPLLEAIAWLQPTYIVVWAVGGWHMAYNIFATVRARTNSLEEEIEKKLSKLENKKEKEVIIKIKNEIRELIEGLARDYVKTEEKINEYLNFINSCFIEIDNLKEKIEDKEIYNLVKSFINIPMEMLYWYSNGVSFLKKGIAYNKDRYDLYFELGWTYYHKGKDYPNAVRYLEKAIRFPHPEFVDDVLAHAYEKNGQIDLAIKQWEKLLNTSFQTVAERAIHSLKTTGKFTP